MKTLLFVVDMINGFIKEGAMHDEKIMQIVQPIQKQCEQYKDIIFVVDQHQSDAIEFKSFPTHCLKRSSESDVIDELQPYMMEIMPKNSTNAFHVLEKEILQDYDQFMIVGCCSDICILQFALSLRTYLNQENLDKEVRVPANCIATYDAPNHDANEYHTMALNLMSQSGINIKEA